MGRGLTQSNDVANQTEESHIEVSILDVLATSEERYGDRDSVTDSQANDTHAGEGIECSCGTKVDDPKNNLHSHTEHHSVQWDVKLGVNLLPPCRTWNGSISRESEHAARSGSCAADTTEDGQDQDWDAERKGASFRIDGADDDWGKGLPREETDKEGQIGDHEEEADKEDEAANEV